MTSSWSSFFFVFFFDQSGSLRISVILVLLIVFISAVKRLIAINRIQIKSFCLHNICVCTVYIYYVYTNTHTCNIYFENIYMDLHVYIYIYIIHIIYKYI